MTKLLELLGHNQRLAHQEVVALAAPDGLPAEFWTSYSALANSLGGAIVLGAQIDQKEGRISAQGLQSVDQMMEEIYEGLGKNSKVSANLLYNSRIYPIEYEGVTLLLVEVPKAGRKQRPVSVGKDLLGGCYRREKGRDRLCTREEIHTMRREREEHVDSRLIEELELTSLEEASVHRYRVIFSAKRPSHPWNELGYEEFLVRIGAAGYGGSWKWHPTVAGLLFFGEREVLRQAFPKYVLDYREILAGGSWLNRVSSRDPDWSGNIFDFYCRAIDSLTGAVPAPGWMEAARGRTFLAEAGGCIGELFANALIHADYYGGGGIVADQAEEYIRIANPGSLLVDVYDAQAGGVTEYRNEALAKLFHLIGIGTGSGEGLHRVVKTWERYRLPPIQISEFILMNRVTVTAWLKRSENRDTAHPRRQQGAKTPDLTQEKRDPERKNHHPDQDAGKPAQERSMPGGDRQTETKRPEEEHDLSLILEEPEFPEVILRDLEGETQQESEEDGFDREQQQ